MKRPLRAILLAVLSVFYVAGGVLGEPLRESVPSVSVIGEAFEDVPPDRATLNFGIVTERPLAAEAASENARVATTVLDELKTLGVADADIRTEGVTLTPVTDQERDPKGRVVGVRKYFIARNDLSVRVRDFAKAGEMAGRLVDRGVNSFQGVHYDYSKPEAKMDELRAKAAKDALRRAEAYAGALGLRLARVLEIRPADEEFPQPRPYAMKAASAAPDGAPAPMRPGVQRISARVAVVWALSH